MRVKLPIGELLVWDAETGQEHRYIEFPKTAIASTVVFNPEGNQLISGNFAGELEVWDIKSGRLVKRIR